MRIIHNSIYALSLLSISLLTLGILSFDGKAHAEGWYCNVAGSPCETLNVNDCRSIYYNWQSTGACTTSYLDAQSCDAATSCTY